jgi:ubiquinone/menaquinone biosynthesis C-methylase UbiE
MGIIEYIKKIRKKIIIEKEDKVAFNLFNNCGKILDVGTGNCEFISLDPKRIEGIDIKPEYGRERGFNIKKGSCLKLPYKDKSFDGVHCSHVIEHLTPKELSICLSEFDRILKIGGILTIRSPLFNQKFYLTPDHIRPYPPNSLELILCNNTGLPFYFNLQKYKTIKIRYRLDFGDFRFWETGYIGLPILFSGYLISFEKINQ